MLSIAQHAASQLSTPCDKPGQAAADIHMLCERQLHGWEADGLGSTRC